MGSFNAVCAISGLPIAERQRVRFLALTQSRYSSPAEHVCHVSGRWQVRTPPIRARYNDYGSIKDIDEPLSLTARVFFESFAIDAIERGVGDNIYHDHAVRPHMSRTEWLQALFDGRVQVCDDLADKAFKDPPLLARKMPKGVPTLTLVEHALRAAGLEVGHGCYLVDEQAPGYFRVRWRGPTVEKPLTKARHAIRQAGFAAMLTAGTGNYADRQEVLVAPSRRVYPHGVAGMGGSGLGDKTPRPVSQAMVLEEVWQHMLSQGAGMTDGQLRAEQVKRGLSRANKTGAHSRDAFYALMSLTGPEGTSGFGLQSSYMLATRLTKNEEEIQGFVRDLAEMVQVEDSYARLCGQWHPTSNGGQMSEWTALARYHEMLKKLCEGM